MNTYNDFQQLAYINKVGHKPANKPSTPKKTTHVGNWNLEYRYKILEYNLPYAVCVTKMKEYKMDGSYNKTKFKIVPCKQ